MGLSTRPIRIEPAIIIPAVISPLITNSAPSPSTKDCRHRRRDLLREVITEPVSLAVFCKPRNCECTANQRVRNAPSMPMAWMVSALCKWLVASCVDCWE
ncbi:hypothetical protein PS720_06363 [Pseudomonas fluorescens]|nr:hypothetical protein PS720_06363 [Pseudomonas fluorescens]